MTKNYTLQTISVILFLFCLTNVSAQNVYSNYTDGQLYVKLTSENIDLLSLMEKNEAYEKFDIVNLEATFSFSKSSELRRIVKLYFNSPEKVEELIKLLNEQNVVEYAEKVPLHKTYATPNDPSHNENSMWHIFKIQAEEAWDIGTGDAEIIVGVVDGAITTNHNDLSPSLWENEDEIAGNNVDDDNNGKVDDVNGWDMADGDNNTNPPSTSGTGWDHGSHVAGTAGAATNNGIGVSSIGYGITILPVKTGYSCNGTGICLRNTAEGVTYAYENGAKVINMSYGGGGYSNTEKTVMETAYNGGTVLVSAAGNNGNSNQDYPAAYEVVIAVANTDQNDKKNSQSTYGTWVDISAPGTSIYSTSYSDGQYVNKDGTSMASPLVAGLCGLMLSKNPDLSPQEVKDCLFNTADDIDAQNPSYVGKLGAGRINAYQAMLCVAETVEDEVALDAGISDIETPDGNYCSGDITPIVTLKNFGTDNLTSVTIKYQVNSETEQSYSWTGALAQNQSEQVTLSQINVGGGSHTFKAYTDLPNGGVDSVETNDESNTSFTVQSVSSLPFEEGFEASGFPYNGWEINNPDNQKTWERTDKAAKTGSYSMYMNNINYQANGPIDEITLPTLDFTNVNQMTFDLAYALLSPSGWSDTLEVLISVDCGETYTSVYKKAGDDLTTKEGLETSEFIPEDDEWRLETIDLSSFIGNASATVMFRHVCDYENNLYVDNINIVASVSSVVADFSGFPTTICPGQSVQFQDESTGDITSWNWTFEGGTPANSTEENPLVMYESEGSFSVTLEVGDGNSTDTKVESSYIVVNQTAIAEAGASADTVYVNVNGEAQVIFNSLGSEGDDYSWDFGDGNNSTDQNPIHTYTEEGTYDVVLTVSSGSCSASDSLVVVVSNNGVIDGVLNNKNEKARIYYQGKNAILVLNQSYSLITIYDVQGRVISKYENLESQTLKLTDLNTNSGIYYLQLVNTNGEVENLKIQKY